MTPPPKEQGESQKIKTCENCRPILKVCGNLYKYLCQSIRPTPALFSKKICETAISNMKQQIITEEKQVEEYRKQIASYRETIRKLVSVVKRPHSSDCMYHLDKTYPCSHCEYIELAEKQLEDK